MVPIACQSSRPNGPGSRAVRAVGPTADGSPASHACQSFVVHLCRRSTDEMLGLRFQFQDNRAVVKDVRAGMVSGWNTAVHRACVPEHAVRPGDMAVFLNDRLFYKQASAVLLASPNTQMGQIRTGSLSALQNEGGWIDGSFKTRLYCGVH